MHKKYCNKPRSREDKLNRNTKELMERRRLKREEHDSNSDEIRNLNKEISKEIRKDLRKYNREQVQQTIEKNKNMKLMRRKLTEGKHELFKLKDTNGNETTDRRRLLEITKQFYEELYASQIKQYNYRESKKCSEGDEKHLKPQGKIQF
ncbi:hypothetical protein ILUMI_25616 [Ignelater luminosus]|uniref:Uncharacterized protein n=1 Tax=Ignelater luminosus TaxID=2038154 RepID=A0A8K0CBC4_IGNLU|nr:hypothetical protein ILUMI_25616 [Ignelater luminosus]